MNFDLGGCCSFRKVNELCAVEPTQPHSIPAASTAHASPQPAQGDSTGKPAATPSGELAGVGIVFRAEESGHGLRVAALAVGGPADMAGKIGINDQLISLDKIDVRNMEPGELAPYILGPPGSAVTLGFQAANRANGDSTTPHGIYYLELKRGWASMNGSSPSPSQPPAWSAQP